MIGRGLPIALIAVLAVAAFAGPGAVASPGQAAKKPHAVNWTWRADAQDIVPGGNEVLDNFIAFGRPFGKKERTLTTSTPRSQIGTDRRSGDWTLFLGEGRCFGTFDVAREVIETTETSQTVSYNGTAKIDKCRKTSKLNGMKAGKIGTIDGETVCTAGGCQGGLVVKGTVRY